MRIRPPVVVSVAILLTAVVIANPESRGDDRGRFKLDVKSIHDGDTVLATVRLPWGISLGPEAVRASNYDAWEVTKARRSVEVTDDEIAKGKAAREFLAALVGFAANGQRGVGDLYLTPNAGGKRDVYGRVLGEFWLRRPDGEWVDIAEEMKRRGHVRRPTPQDE